MRKRARRHSSRRRQRPLLLAGAGALALALATWVSVASFTGTDLAAAAVHQAKSFVELMNQRSPAERTAAHLIKIKRKFAHRVAERSPPPLPEAFVVRLTTPAPVLMTNPIIPEAAPLLAALTPLEIVPGPGIFPPPGGGGGGGGGGGPPPPGPPPPPPPAVPEPGTWMTMLLGFGLTGWLLRSRRTARSQPAGV